MLSREKLVSRCDLVVVHHFPPCIIFLATSLAEGSTLGAQGASHLLNMCI